MKSFKQFFVESIESETNLPPPPEKFAVPSPKVRFQLGDVVLVQNPRKYDADYVRRKTPKHLHNYTNAVGRVIGHRTIGSAGYATTEFALEFEDKKIGKVKSSLLVGPFRSFDSAKKYQGRDELISNDIAPEDHKRHAEARKEIESNEDIENTFKRLFVREGEFEWLNEPISFIEGKIKVLILAFKRMPNNEVRWYAKPESISDEIGSSLLFYKKIDLITNKLVKTTIFNEGGGSSTYGIGAPQHNPTSSKFENGKVSEMGLYFGRQAINTSRSLELVSKQVQKLEKTEKVKDGMTYFDLINNVRTEGNLKIVPVSTDNYLQVTSIKEGVTKDVNAFKNYVFEGSVIVFCTVNKQAVFPKEVKGKMFTIRAKIENLNGFPKLSKGCAITIAGEVESFSGLPQILDHFLDVNYSPSLKDFPKVINGNCAMSGIGSFKGGENTEINGTLTLRDLDENISYKEIPTAKKYVWHGKDQDAIEKIKAWVQKRNIVTRDLSKDFDISALDDF